MSTVAVTLPPGRQHAPSVGSPLTGAVALLRLALRRDRIRLSIWIASLTLLIGYTPSALELAYPDHAQRLSRLELTQTPAGIMLSGPTFGRNETALGAMVANELMLTTIVAASILAILTVVRHTRADEESGAAELVLSSVVGRYARTAAALLLVAGVNAVLAVTMTLALVAAGLGTQDSAAMSLGITAVAMVFAGVGAVTAQLWRTSRAATGTAMAVLGLAVLIRGVGDVIDRSGSVLSWFSPIAWAQQMRAFVDLRWWPLGLLVALTVALIALAAVLEVRRQYDAGTFPSTGERPNARPIRSVFGLHLTLQRGQLIGWSVALFLTGLVLGSLTQSMLDAAADNELIAAMMARQGPDGAYTTMTQFLAAAAGAYVVAAVLRVYSDEQSGLAEPVLAAAVSRWHWLLSAVAAAVSGAAALMLCAGVGHGVGAAITLGEPATVWRLTLAGLAHLPALTVLAGVAAVAVALRQPLIGWLAVIFVVASLYLGALLRLPQWVIDLSPVSQTTVPLEFPAAALVVMVVVAVTLTVAAGWIYRRRDAV